MHAFKTEDLNMTKEEADKVLNVLREFLDNLGYHESRIDNLECRRRDGFIPYSHNYGGLEAVAFSDQLTMYFNMTGFEEADATLEKYYQYEMDNYKESHNIPKDAELTDDQRDEMEQGYSEDDQATVLISTDIMLTSDNSLNVRMCICVKDAPYHRQYDSKIDKDFNFKNHKDLKSKLDKFLKTKDAKRFSSNLSLAY